MCFAKGTQVFFSFYLGRNQSNRGKSMHVFLVFKSSTFLFSKHFFLTFSHSSSFESFLGHFPPHPWLFCQSSVLFLALVLQNFSLSVTFIQVESPPPWSFISVHFFDFSHRLGPRGNVLMFEPCWALGIHGNLLLTPIPGVVEPQIRYRSIILFIGLILNHYWLHWNWVFVLWWNIWFNV